MKKKFLIVCAAILIIAMITVPVIAAPTPANPLDQILSFVKDYKTKLDTILTKLTSLQTDVTTIKTTVSDINTKVQQPPQQKMCNWYSKTFTLLSASPIKLSLVNYGDTGAEVEYWFWEGNQYLTQTRYQKVTIPKGTITSFNIDGYLDIIGNVVRIRAPPQVTPKWLEFTDSGGNNHFDDIDFFTMVCE